MNENKYREAFDEISFSADFQARTVELLRSHAQERKTLEKEQANMKLKFIRKPAVAVAIAAALIVSASAAAVTLWRSSAQVAEELGEPLLAEAFASDDAVLLNQSVETGDFNVTLLGLVSGVELTSWEQGVDASHTYAVVGLSRLDGTPLENESFSFSSYTLTPLVAGYSPNSVNNWTLGSFASGVAVDGNYYYLLDTQDLGIFADRTVYLAFYEGFVPDNQTFFMAEDGSISFAEDFDGVHALFTLPLDESLADPDAAAAFVDPALNSSWSNESRAEDTGDSFISSWGAQNSHQITLGAEDDVSADADKVWYSVARSYILEEAAELQKQLEAGALSQEEYDKAVAELEETLTGLENGSLIAVSLNEEDGTFTIIPQDEWTQDTGVQYQLAEDDGSAADATE